MPQQFDNRYWCIVLLYMCVLHVDIIYLHFIAALGPISEKLIADLLAVF